MTAQTEELTEIFPGDSEMARIMRQWDWGATPLGDPHGWPEGLRIPLRMLLTSRFEMWLGWGPDLCFFYNDAYIPTLGIKHPVMLGKPFREVWSEVYADVEDQVARVRAGEATWNNALLLLLERNGYPEETYHSFSYSPLHGPTGAVDGMLCVVSEETERVISARRLDVLRMLGMRLVGIADEDEALDAVCDAFRENRRDFPFAFIHLPRDGHAPRHACSADEKLLFDRDWPLDDLDALGNGRKIVLPSDLPYPTGDWDRPPTEAIIVPISVGANAKATGAMVLGLNPHRPDDDDALDIARLLAGQLSGALANVATLRSERRRADRIWSHSRDLMVIVDANGIFRSVSPAWTRILGHAEDEVVGRSLEDFVIADDVPATWQALGQAVGNIDLMGFENRLRGRDGRARWFSWQTAVEDGLVYGYGRDITEQKANAEALAIAETALRQSQKMEAVRQLTGGIAHDFNNLLTGIIGSLEMMQIKANRGQTDEIRRYAALATGSANRAASLTQRLLAFSRRQTLDPKPVDANQLVTGVEDLVRRTIGEAIRLRLDLAPSIWRTKCDPNQLESAILNLAINGRDAMPEGGDLTITTSNNIVGEERPLREQIVSPGAYVVICVADTGQGMSADVMARAFEPFFTTKPLGEGTGLGLSMIYGFARQSGGFALLDSEEGRGTKVRLYLPRSEEAPADEPVEQSAILTARKNDTVLVVEDEAAVRALVVDVLNDLGYKTVEAQDGASGLEIVQSNLPIDLLITDVGLPGLNGRQLADAARLSRPDLKILFVTGYDHSASIAARPLQAGMEIITKPFTLEKLAGRVRSMFESQGLSQ